MALVGLDGTQLIYRQSLIRTIEIDHDSAAITPEEYGSMLGKNRQPPLGFRVNPVLMTVSLLFETGVITGS